QPVGTAATARSSSASSATCSSRPCLPSSRCTCPSTTTQHARPSALHTLHSLQLCKASDAYGSTMRVCPALGCAHPGLQVRLLPRPPAHSRVLLVKAQRQWRSAETTQADFGAGAARGWLRPVSLALSAGAVAGYGP